MLERADDAFCDECPIHDLQLLPENEQAVHLYMLCQTQWRYPPLGGAPIGLDMLGMWATARLARIRVTTEVFEKIKLLERTALEIFRDRNKEDGNQD